jgi:hypothetical protein
MKRSFADFLRYQVEYFLPFSMSSTASNSVPLLEDVPLNSKEKRCLELVLYSPTRWTSLSTLHRAFDYSIVPPGMF